MADYDHAYALMRDLRLTEAEAEFRAVTEAEPDNLWAAIHLGELLMMRGAFAEGLPLLERRVQLPDMLTYLFSALGPALWQIPGWDGRPVAGRLLIVGEQGLGDTLMVARFLPWAAARCGELFYYGNLPGLEWLLTNIVPGIRVLPLGSPIPVADAFVLAMSLPSLARTTVDTLPAPPYLTVDPLLLQDWRDYFAGFGGINLGICWRGNPDNARDRDRSIPLTRMATAVARPGVTLHSLQLEDTEEERRALAVTDLRDRLLRPPGPKAQTVAAMIALDHCVTVDTAVAHFAGALDLPAHVMIQRAPYWPYGIGDTVSPWYPSLRLIRADGHGQWDRALMRLSSDLDDILK
jgi:hypothetical protein